MAGSRAHARAQGCASEGKPPESTERPQPAQPGLSQQLSLDVTQVFSWAHPPPHQGPTQAQLEVVHGEQPVSISKKYLNWIHSCPSGQGQLDSAKAVEKTPRGLGGQAAGAPRLVLPGPSCATLGRSGDLWKPQSSKR